MCWRASPCVCVCHCPLVHRGRRAWLLCRDRGVGTHPLLFLPRASTQVLLFGSQAMKGVKSSPPRELETTIPVQICPFLYCFHTKCHMERVCKCGVSHTPLRLLSHLLLILKYLGDLLQVVLGTAGHYQSRALSISDHFFSPAGCFWHMTDPHHQA